MIFKLYDHCRAVQTRNILGLTAMLKVLLDAMDIVHSNIMSLQNGNECWKQPV